MTVAEHPAFDASAERTSWALLHAIPNPVISLESDGRVRFANTAAEQFFQTSARMLMRMKLTDIIPFSSPLGDLISYASDHALSVNEYDVSIGTPRTGGERTVDVQLAPVSEVPGMLLLQIWQKSMAQKIDRQLTHRSSARAVMGMASMLAHEIKNPLSGIRGAAQLLEPVLGDDDKALTALICTETDRVRDLVDQMEVFSDDRPLVREPVNIHSVLDHVKSIAGIGVADGLKIREQYDPSLPPVHGNRDQLVQVLLNLVKNAAEAIAMDANRGEITLTTAFRPGVRLSVKGSGERVSLPLEVCVHNSGPPIPDDIRPHLFDPFVSSKSGGKGLGLALVAKIVRDHGGVVECETHPGKTTFRILLPLYDVAEPSGRAGEGC